MIIFNIFFIQIILNLSKRYLIYSLNYSRYFYLKLVAYLKDKPYIIYIKNYIQIKPQFELSSDCYFIKLILYFRYVGYNN